jgi:hypothetical protein
VYGTFLGRVLGMKACWADYTELPMSCALDGGDEVEIYGCVHARNGGVLNREHCEHWNEQLAVELCKEILGDDYIIRSI